MPAVHEIKARKAQVKEILAKTFPQYKGRKFKVVFQPTITFHDTNWGGGSRTYYATVKSNGQSAIMPVPAPWENEIEGKTIEIPLDVLMVTHTFFCGQDMGITIYAHPSHLPIWLKSGE